MKSKIAASGVIALLAGILACGGERSPVPSAVSSQEDALLAVTNDHWLDAAVYAVRGGTRYRIGTVTGLSTDTIPLRGTVVGPGTVRLLIEPIGLSQRHFTEPIQVDPGEVVELNIRSPLNLSYVTVWRR